MFSKKNPSTTSCPLTSSKFTHPFWNSWHDMSFRWNPLVFWTPVGFILPFSPKKKNGPAAPFRKCSICCFTELVLSESETREADINPWNILIGSYLILKKWAYEIIPYIHIYIYNIIFTIVWGSWKNPIQQLYKQTQPILSTKRSIKNIPLWLLLSQHSFLMSQNQRCANQCVNGVMNPPINGFISGLH